MSTSVETTIQIGAAALNNVNLSTSVLFQAVVKGTPQLYTPMKKSRY